MAFIALTGDASPCPSWAPNIIEYDCHEPATLEVLLTLRLLHS